MLRLHTAFPILIVALSATATGTAAEDDLPPAETAETASAAHAPRKAMNLYAMLSPELREAELERRHLAGGTTAELLERVSRGLLGAPYVLSPLGEESGADADPRIRADAFDCTTFVETAIALAGCDGWVPARDLLDHIRYTGGSISFASRRHLMNGQWIEGLVGEGLLEDISASVGGEHAKVIPFEMTPERWKHRRIAKTLDLAIDRVPMGRFPITVVPIELLAAHPDLVPAGTVLNVIRADVPWSPVLVTHQGLVLVRPGETQRIVRHASPISKRVIDEPLDHMMKRYLAPKPWPVIGVNLLRVKG